ncbi:sigma-54-dependent Fis family transcriptional regulator [Planctomycetales bacterium ZRK34]|nr:sigma-54-dependent Fis family transcriptional regulator [Planctomycetales bacterium ZRK34]
MSSTHEQKINAHVMVVDDDPIVGESLERFLQKAGYNTATAGDGHEALAMLRDAEEAGEPFNLVLSDVNMPRSGGVELLKQIRKHHDSTVVIMMTGYGTIESAVEAVKLGAFDYLTKPIVDEELVIAVAKALRQQALLAENATLRHRLAGRGAGDTMIGQDRRMQKVYDLVEAVAPTNTTVMIGGESGTGKTMVASAIHDRSTRKSKPFVTFSCGSIPETLLESELFGHVKGAFTGADADKLGKLRAAEGGTLFIDEINSATPALQLKLLRVLQEKKFEPVGSHQTVKVDVRFVIASNESLDRLVEEGRFREDLFYRINVVTIHMPALRERASDVPLLAEHFLHKYCRETGKVITGFTQDGTGALMRYRWPGNVRELENAVERAVVLSRRPTIDLDDLPESIRCQSPDGEPGFVERRKNPGWWANSSWKPQPLKDALMEPERQIILATLRANDWNRQKTAEILDINRTTLYKKIKQYKLEELAAG